jgi:hypothetical protein
MSESPQLQLQRGGEGGIPCSGASDVAGFKRFQHLKLAEMGCEAFRWRA